MDLVNELLDKTKELDGYIEVLKKRGIDLANKERDYKVVLRQEALKLRADGQAVTLIDKTVYGVKEVADKRLERDVAETLYQTALEKINTSKLQIRIMQNILDKEWGKNE